MSHLAKWKIITFSVCELRLFLFLDRLPEGNSDEDEKYAKKANERRTHTGEMRAATLGKYERKRTAGSHRSGSLSDNSSDNPIEIEE